MSESDTGLLTDIRSSLSHTSTWLFGIFLVSTILLLNMSEEQRDQTELLKSIDQSLCLEANGIPYVKSDSAQADGLFGPNSKCPSD